MYYGGLTALLEMSFKPASDGAEAVLVDYLVNLFRACVLPNLVETWLSWLTCQSKLGLPT